MIIDWLILLMLLKLRDRTRDDADDELQRIIEPAAGLRLDDVLKDKRPHLRSVK